MKITIERGEIQKKAVEAVVVNLFEGIKKPSGATAAVDRTTGGMISRAMACGDFTGKRNQLLVQYPSEEIKIKRVIAVGLGPQDGFNLEGARQAAATAAKALQKLGVKRAATVLHGAGAGGIDVEEAAQAVAEASILSCYRFDSHKSKPTRDSVLMRLIVMERDGKRLPSARSGLNAGVAIGEATCLARDLVNSPGNTANPSYLARCARQLARIHGLGCRIIDETGMKRLGMGAILGVSRGSRQPARFLILEHNKKAGGKPLIFVGKGVTFDTGGISLKPSTGMEDMKGDMAGAAAVLGAMQAIGALKVPRYVVGLVPAVENMPDGEASRPGDVLTTMAGKTIEIISTDAEGRLILADALSYAKRYQPIGVVDLATLTGACVTALGHDATGLMSNDDELTGKVRRSGEATQERVWPLPLWDEHRELIRSDVADMKNSGGRPAGALTAAALLKEFVDYPWVHLDIAGTAWTSRSRPYVPKGAVGVGVRLLTHMARNWEEH